MAWRNTDELAPVGWSCRVGEGGGIPEESLTPTHTAAAVCGQRTTNGYTPGPGRARPACRQAWTPPSRELQPREPWCITGGVWRLRCSARQLEERYHRARCGYALRFEKPAARRSASRSQRSERRSILDMYMYRSWTGCRRGNHVASRIKQNRFRGQHIYVLMDERTGKIHSLCSRQVVSPPIPTTLYLALCARRHARACVAWPNGARATLARRQLLSGLRPRLVSR